VGVQDTEILIAYMLIEGFLGEVYTYNAYGSQVYLTPGRLSHRLDEGQKLVVHLLQRERAARDQHMAEGCRKRKAGRPPHSNRGGVRAHSSDEGDADFGDYSGEDGEEVEVEQENGLDLSAKRRRSNPQSSWVPTRAPLNRPTAGDDVVSDSDPEESEWKGNLRGAPASSHRTMRSSPRRLSGATVSGTESVREMEVIEISSD
jgi:hypothetical protein